jgi:hypothetical protein
MHDFIHHLRHGTWLTRERVLRVATILLIGYVASFVFLFATAHGLNDYAGRPLGTDFSNVYAAGTYVLEGKAALAFDPASQHAREQAIFGVATPFYGWCYPPFFLFVAALLALMPYMLALLVWQFAALALCLLSIREILRSVAPGPLADHQWLWLLLALAFPAVFVNIGHAHNGFLTAALLGLALALLDRRPIVSGILFGLLAYKPQFGLMIPLALIAGGYWRTTLAAAGTIGALILVTTAAFGLEVWRAFFESTHFTQTVVLEAGETGWHKIQSVFSWARMWGAPVSLAYAAQLIAILALAACLIRLWRNGAEFAHKAAALCIAALLATPYSLDYDMMVLAPAIALLLGHGAARGFLAWEKTAIAGLWLVPLIARGAAEYALLPLGVITMIGVLALVMYRSITQSREVSREVACAR